MNSRKCLSRLPVDLGVWRGHGFRLSWARVCPIPRQPLVLISLASGLKQEKDTIAPLQKQQRQTVIHADKQCLADSANSSEFNRTLSFGFGRLAFNSWAQLVEPADEHLLNAAISTSSQVTQSQAISKDIEPQPISQGLINVATPQLMPSSGLAPLHTYSQALAAYLTIPDALPSVTASCKNFDLNASHRMRMIRRLLSLCQALWGEHFHHERQQQHLHDNQIVSEDGNSMADSPASQPGGATGPLFDSDFIQEKKDTYSEIGDVCAATTGPLDDLSTQLSRAHVQDEIASKCALRQLVRKQALSEWISCNSVLKMMLLNDDAGETFVNVPSQCSNAGNHDYYGKGHRYVLSGLPDASVKL
ncbi:unnamed protein product [Protopolystoma xenopodis]|uniref:Uncharacterized protein n=1 Tax=Protopolystoma xenopodis TaxID=117903 RepID=A0A448WLS6_9PLAT|nr:unnamed protein product [Protopolystoma xenopodis]